MAKGLSYPIAEVPESGRWLEVAEDVFWLRMPLPLALDHINLYCLRDGDGWVVVDTGIGGTVTQQYWEVVFDQLFEQRPIKRVIVTHMHPDHVGQAGWLCERFRSPLLMSRAEYLSARAFSHAPTTDGFAWTTEHFFRRSGLDLELVEQMRQRFRGYGRLVEAMPMAYQRLRDGDELTINGRTWLVWTGEGHSPEHVCLFNPERNILLSGDQLLPEITPNVSVLPAEPLGNPLAEWLEGLDRLGRRFPANTLVLPAHNRPFIGLPERVRAITNHHESKLIELAYACQEPRTARELLPVMFKRTLDPGQITLALGECVAHLHLLLARGIVSKSVDEQGVERYRREVDLDEDIDRELSPSDTFMMV